MYVLKIILKLSKKYEVVKYNLKFLLYKIFKIITYKYFLIGFWSKKLRIFVQTSIVLLQYFKNFLSCNLY